MIREGCQRPPLMITSCRAYRRPGHAERVESSSFCDGRRTRGNAIKHGAREIRLGHSPNVALRWDEMSKYALVVAKRDGAPHPAAPSCHAVASHGHALGDRDELAFREITEEIKRLCIGHRIGLDHGQKVGASCTQGAIGRDQIGRGPGDPIEPEN